MSDEEQIDSDLQREMEDVVKECIVEEEEKRIQEEKECKALPHPDKIFNLGSSAKKET